MGWVSSRHIKQGGSLNPSPKNNGSDKGPLRKIIRIIRAGSGWFSHDIVELECGHESRSTGGLRARCPQCKKES